MIAVLGHNITSPLGGTSADNFTAVMGGHASIHNWHNHRGVPGDYVASLFDDQYFANYQSSDCSKFESLVISSARKAIVESGINTSDGKTLLVLSTTKGNIDWLDDGVHNRERILPPESAKIIGKALGIMTVPIVVDNACISGLSAIITACRMLEMGLYDNAVVCGAEIQSKFIISGFQSLKAVSPKPCRPFDIERMGLNLGEAAATIILSTKTNQSSRWYFAYGCTRNDAYHLSAPSRNGEGLYESLVSCVGNYPREDIAFINAHGTATMFNDQMESVAIQRAGLNDIPVVGLKGYFGHTMGACGVLETILSMLSVDNGVILPTKGFHEIGVSGKIDVVSNIRETKKGNFIKTLSGFGGGNACVLFTKDKNIAAKNTAITNYVPTHHIHITENGVGVDNETILTSSTGKALLTELYKKYVGDYPKFYKMDILSRLGFIATELLLKAEKKERFIDRNDRATVLIGHYGSMVADINYLDSIKDPNNYFPSPERFVYTLPNIVTGEIAIRNHYHGETGYYYLEERNDAIIDNIIRSAFVDDSTHSVIGGWIDCSSDESFEADLSIVERLK